MFNIDKVISKVERILIGRIKNNHIQLDKRVDKELNLKGYKNEFSQVILNLINNALDEFESPNKNFKEKSIFIETLKKENICIIRIKDNAGGIPKEYLEKIFDTKFSLKQKETLGIGLTICKNIIEKNFKGELQAYNENEGAVLEIKIPL
ncbi:sensor histidine kinase [Halarcobacter anaerophilus]|uniref:sensor histidine kinase n=1 Tax=Halarcobacter anaerophilus TaxID=877500 RepID=UPI0005C7EF5D|nr:HAMP domain-containing sensor histidine kinase [Halarcobacter anaerophilus]